jgi:hypothetical protein
MKQRTYGIILISSIMKTQIGHDMKRKQKTIAWERCAEPLRLT